MFPTPSRSSPRLFLPPTIPEEQAVLICGDCSARNEDGESFCTNCGAYLEWQRPAADAAHAHQADIAGSASKSPPDTAELPQITVPPVRTPGKLAEPRQRTPHGRRTASAGNGNPGQSGTVRAGGVPGGAGRGGQESRQEPDGDGKAKSEPVTVLDVEPAAVKPGQRIASAPRVIPVDSEASTAAGELICATCGTGNRADRSFCRRCAASLEVEPVAEASEAPRLAWWRRLFGQAEGRALPAGTRPRWKSRRFPTRSAALVAVLGLLGGGAYANSDSIGGAPQRVLDELFDDPAAPTTMNASDTIDDRKPELANDRFSNTSWSGRLKDGERSNFLEATFAGPTRLVYVFITGLKSEPPPSREEQRPSKVLISVRHEGAKDGTPYQDIFPVVEVADDGNRHGFYVGADNVRDVRLTIIEPNSPAAKAVSIAGVQFSKR